MWVYIIRETPSHFLQQATRYIKSSAIQKNKDDDKK